MLYCDDYRPAYAMRSLLTESTTTPRSSGGSVRVKEWLVHHRCSVLYHLCYLPSLLTSHSLSNLSRSRDYSSPPVPVDRPISHSQTHPSNFPCTDTRPPVLPRLRAQGRAAPYKAHPQEGPQTHPRPDAFLFHPAHWMDVVGRDSVMLAVCWDAWEGGVRARLIDQAERG
jgi:hypothetical protein